MLHENLTNASVCYINLKMQLINKVNKENLKLKYNITDHTNSHRRKQNEVIIMLCSLNISYYSHIICDYAVSIV